jgi:polyisoprenoid-binding protein YceI
MSSSPASSTTAAAWRIDPAHSHVEFAVRHLMISTVKGRFSDVAGTVTMHGTDVATAAVDVMIGAASIDTREAQRDAHLRSADFFDVDRFPVLTFKSRRVDARPAGRFALVGDLTIHGVTREVALDVTSEGAGRDPWGNERMGFSAKGVLNRKDFGLVWNQLLETGGIAVGDEVKIAIDVELIAGAVTVAA